jgi:DNA gyrase subunit B
MEAMTEHSGPWTSTTHDWAVAVDRNHLAAIRSDPGTYAPGGMRHLVLEVLAYANDEAEALGRRGKAVVTFHTDGSVSVADDGRGTDTRRDADHNIIKKPIMATKDLRFFDPEHQALLPDGTHRRGMSVVAALSQWLTHTNRRQNGAWTQRYEHGLPSSDLLPIDPENGTGTTVHFLGDHDLMPAMETTPDCFRDVDAFPWLSIVVKKE